MTNSGFFGTRASFSDDIALVLEILFYVMLCLGVVAQRYERHEWHNRLQIPVVTLNLVLIAFTMLAPFSNLTQNGDLNQVPVAAVVVHGLAGTIAQGLAIYCLLAGLKILPRKIGVLRYWMWATFIAWTATMFFGLTIYIVRYVLPK